LIRYAQLHIGDSRRSPMARREEKVDTELLARLESGGDRIRVPLPNRKVNEMFAIADQILGGRRVRAVCEDGDSRLARIPGKMRRRQWVREGDLIVVQPWDFQDEKANVCMRYTKTQSLYLSRKGVLPEIVICSACPTSRKWKTSTSRLRPRGSRLVIRSNLRSKRPSSPNPKPLRPRILRMT